MPYIDAQTRLWSSAALTSTAVSTNCYDLGAPFTSGGVAKDLGPGEPLCVDINVEVAGDHTTGDETYEFQLITATATDLTTNQAIVLTTGTIPNGSVATSLAAGARIVLPIPPSLLGQQRYLGAKYVGAGTTPTITVSASIKPLSFVQAQAYYSTAIVIN